MSKAIRYIECTHCGETVGTYYVNCPYCGYRAGRAQSATKGEMYGLTQVTTESEQTENTKQTAGREIDTSEYPFIQLEADELVRMICDAYQTGVFSGKEQS